MRKPYLHSVVPRREQGPRAALVQHGGVRQSGEGGRTSCPGAAARYFSLAPIPAFGLVYGIWTNTRRGRSVIPARNLGRRGISRKRETTGYPPLLGNAELLQV